jgi:hypothetical protein
MESETIEWVKNNFTIWGNFCDDNENKLKTAMKNALLEINEYIEVTEDQLIDTRIGRHFLIITKKNCFNYKHGDTEFERDPQIVKDYNATIELLEDLSSTRSINEEDTEDGTNITMKARSKLFDTWFTNLREEDVT